MPARSRKQQQFFGMVRAAQKGEMKNPSPEIKKAASSMSKKDVKKYAKTKHDGLPERIREDLFTSFLENYNPADAQKAGEQLVNNKLQMKPPYKKQSTPFANKDLRGGRYNSQTGEIEGPPRAAQNTPPSFSPETQGIIDKARGIGSGKIKDRFEAVQRYVRNPGDEEKYMTPLKDSMKAYTDMTDDQMAAVGLYGGKDYFGDVNKLRRTGQRLDDPEKARLIDFISENFEGGLQNIGPASAGEETSFIGGKEVKRPNFFNRAVTGDFARRLAELTEGDEFQDLGFGSYTNRGGPTLDQFFGDDDNAMIRLNEGAQLRDISPITQYNEGEHISMPGQRFRYKGMEPQGHYSRKTGGYIPRYDFELIEDLADDGKINNSNK